MSDPGPAARTPAVRKGQGSTTLSRAEFEARWRMQFHDPAFEQVPEALERALAVAWDAYEQYRKSPRTVKAGPEFANPDADLALEWVEARRAVQAAAAAHDDPAGDTRLLLICGSPRSDETCPGEMSKTFRLLQHARAVLAQAGSYDLDVLDLSVLTSEYGRRIFPCKACVSTAMPLCHWPCSCYPNHAMGQVQDWMHEIYPRWVAAHAVLIVTPVHWYQAPSALKLMIDRLVCADGGNPDPTTTDGKSPEKAKALELQGWPYPRHLAGRAFGVIVHGDAAGADTVRRSLHDWLADMGLEPAGSLALVDRYVGYYEPYATSHDALDGDEALFAEVANAARTLGEAASRVRAGRHQAGAALTEPRPK